MKRLTKLCLTIFTVTIVTGSIRAQVGIGTIDPDTSVILDIKSPNKGVLLPRVIDLSATRKREGSLVYDTVNGKIKSYHNNQWLNINPLTTDVNNNVIAPADATIQGTLTLNGTAMSAPNATITANTFAGNGTIPVGGIIMWSGSTLPDGWAFCNGAVTNGIQTPDLRGRFIVGYVDNDSQGHTSDPHYTNGTNSATIPTYQSIGAPGGANAIKLDAANMPTHTHDVLDYGHGHSITGEVMQKEGSSTQTVVAIDTQGDVSHGEVTYTNKIGSSKTNVTLRNTGGTYTYTEIPNPPIYYTGCTVWQYTCTTDYGSTFQANTNLAGTTYYSSSTSEALYWADEYGYRVCTPDGSAYCGIGFTDRSLWGQFKTTSCTANASYDPKHPNCKDPLHDSRVSVGTPIRLNEAWNVQPIDIRPTYYVLAFIIRIR